MKLIGFRCVLDIICCAGVLHVLFVVHDMGWLVLNDKAACVAEMGAVCDGTGKKKRLMILVWLVVMIQHVCKV